MKKLVLLLAVVFGVSLVSCGGKDAKKADQKAKADTTQVAPDSKADSTQADPKADPKAETKADPKAETPAK